MSDRFVTKRNTSGGPGWNIIDTTTGKSVAWIYDQEHGKIYPEADEIRARFIAKIFNTTETQNRKTNMTDK